MSVTYLRRTIIMAFGLIDHVILYGSVLLSLGIGTYFGFCKKSQSTEDYLLGNRRMKVIPVALSGAVSYISGVTLLGQSAEVYMYGANVAWTAFSCFTATIIGAYLFLPVIIRLKSPNGFEYLELRFDRKVKVVASCVYTVQLLMYNSVVVYVPAIAYSQVTGVNPQIVAFILCVICVFYTTVGGFKAVIWTDAFQFLGIFAGVVMVIVLGITSIGDFRVILERAKHGHRLDFNFSMDPTLRDGFWQMMIGHTITWLFTINFHPVSVQRYLSLSTFSNVKRVIALQCCGIAFVNFFCFVIGIIIYARYNICDPVMTGEVSRADQLLPYFLMDVGGNVPAVSGVFIAAIFGSALSTLSSMLNSLGAVVYGDVLSLFLNKDFVRGKETLILKLIVFIFGAFNTCLTLFVEQMGGVLPFMNIILGTMFGILNGIFLLGLLFPSANSLGALLGAITGTLTIGTIAVLNHWYTLQGANEKFVLPVSVEGCLVSTNYTFVRKHLEFEPFVLFRISFWYNSVMGLVIVIIVGLFVSCVTKQSTVDPCLLSPIVRKGCDDKTCSQKYVAVEQQCDANIYSFQQDA